MPRDKQLEEDIDWMDNLRYAFESETAWDPLNLEVCIRCIIVPALRERGRGLQDEAIGTLLGLSRAGVACARASAIRKLRHPVRLRKLAALGNYTIRQAVLAIGRNRGLVRLPKVKRRKDPGPDPWLRYHAVRQERVLAQD